ncbi:MAG: BrnA antitoxin family protein [Campylobacteraceae bacterium]|mgnify:CR=1 FL=1|nr:BrnA antitoxin family protein [Campylobacteraceae bacterium]
MKTLKTIPNFSSQEEEKAFWEIHDSSEFMDWREAKKVRFPKLQKSAKTISIRMPVDMIEEVKVQANKLDIPYQSYLKIIISQGIKGRTA